MSQSTLDIPASESLPGLFGKLPKTGDFVTRRLPREFLDSWDSWLQEAITHSREQLAEQWLDCYLTSPIWRFALTQGVCGRNAWVGVLMPSVDRVGRYYPLTLGVAVDPEINLFRLFETNDAWFSKAEQLALSCLDDGFQLQLLDTELASLGIPQFSVPSSQTVCGSTEKSPSPRAEFAWRLEAEDISLPSQVYAALLARLLKQRLIVYSLWWTAGSERIQPSFLVCQGLPRVEGFSALLAGDWHRRGWQDDGVTLPMADSTELFD